MNSIIFVLILLTSVHCEWRGEHSLLHSSQRITVEGVFTLPVHPHTTHILYTHGPDLHYMRVESEQKVVHTVLLAKNVKVGSIAGAEDDSKVVVTYVSESKHTLFFVESDDGGFGWSNPLEISPNSGKWSPTIVYLKETERVYVFYFSV